MLDDFRLRVFMMVAAESSFTRAAQHLGVTQPAVSQHIAELEKQVGVPLFVRKRGEVSLTAEGYVFKDYAARILHWYEATDALFGSAGKLTVNRPVRVAATAYVAAHRLPELLRDLVAITASSFIIETYPEDAFPESMEADLYFYTAARRDTLDFDAGSVIGVVDASLVTVSPELPDEPRYAVWAPYRPLVQPDIYARTVLVSDSIPALTDLVRNNPNLIGILPSDAASGLTLHPDPLPHLRQDLHLRVAESFSRSGVAQWLTSRFE
ncbi:MAG: LysR family transcriptional regulator [Bacteroidales bacterium]|nr:LysR family transcriptional regulator [Bacteroidales bacterium]MBR1491117.1 LysR family transcriptional regulator [Bacteroidales bacterium]